MGSKDLAVIILLIISGELYAEEKPCGFPSVENGRIAQYYYTFERYYFPMSVNQNLTFSCLAGHTTKTGKREARTTCTAAGWYPEPRCFKKCPKPDLRNGYIFDTKLSYNVQENMRYGCSSGYKTTAGQDEEVVQCLPDGWSSQPACRKEHEMCLAPELHHGNYSTTQKTFRVKDKVRYECAPGYHTASGKRTEEVECHSYGWALRPRCAKLKCSSLRLIENGYFHPVKQTYEEGDVVQFFCHKNYYLSGSDLIQCYNFGWYPESPVCEGRRSRCPPPPLPANSNVQTHSATYRHGAAVRLSCELHFEMQGPEEMRCENGKWTEPPKCVEAGERVACGEPPFVENAAAQPSSGGFHSGDKVTYACAPGYHLRGPPEIACRGGQWTAPPACAENTENCNAPPVVINGAVVGEALTSYTTGSSVEYRCNEYYLLRGEKVSHCEQGKWSPPPVCLEPCTVNVDDMRRSNLEMKWQYEGKILHGDLIDFVCKQGYDLPPPTPLSELSVQCDRGRVKYPLCVRKESERTCASPPLIKNGVIKGSTAGTYENGSSVEYRCFEHYFLQGSREAYCSEGAWTAPPLCLEPCTLSLITMENNNLLLKWNFDDRPYIFHGEYVEFLCKRNTFISDFPSMGSELRVQCDRGQLKYPRCIQRERMLSYQEP
ncbi:coagulation factor XIII B chain [Camelus dromedarius]|uniref:Coagulation factor XIII B chain isoform X1 n=2 Tax=Camelus TaxID=9836 RepID=A0A8B6YL97_CAMFR|nr:coagulation factor XIII B chain isoform X1 [Camelus ferus]XP_010954591.1 coagulation factor XIII B chain isoform X1 [Camelus bactrianus]XP_010980486.2 coagulation factor XIII B chain isoform X1 [Camelus dromedarius]XP_031294213.1 coagulation factor XIII B chain isoform X1 [Camelus dromedarius]XP_032322684.1 coagulation factor XIII B chain isoform X1 [Camelus ferus]XP_032322685.1 coagulation factor XIII B chain isoform X1 [Camelus ferus]XP_045373591.1 coagulation factor XIII B chain isoform